MKKLIVLLPLLILAACKTVPPPYPPNQASDLIATNGPPILPKVQRPLITPLVSTAGKKPMERYIKLSYPTNADKFLWQLQESADNKVWYTIAPTAKDAHYTWGTNAWQYWWVGGPGTNTYTVYMTNSVVKFWRTYGIQP